MIFKPFMLCFFTSLVIFGYVECETIEKLWPTVTFETEDVPTTVRARNFGEVVDQIYPEINLVPKQDLAGQMIIYFDRIDKQLTTEWDSPKVVNTEKLSDEYKHAMSTAGSANKKLLKSIKDPNMQKAIKDDFNNKCSLLKTALDKPSTPTDIAAKFSNAIFAAGKLRLNKEEADLEDDQFQIVCDAIQKIPAERITAQIRTQFAGFVYIFRHSQLEDLIKTIPMVKDKAKVEKKGKDGKKETVGGKGTVGGTGKVVEKGQVTEKDKVKKTGNGGENKKSN